MTTVLIVESNPPDLLARTEATGEATAAAAYTAALRIFDVDLTVRVAEPYAKPFDTALCEGVDGVVFTGSGVAWSTDASQAAPLRAAMEAVFMVGLPTLGSCNGMQLAAVVLGGRVGASPNGVEVGLARDVRLTAAGRHHALLADRAARYNVPCVHRDEVVALPAGASHLAENDHSPVQAFAYEDGSVDFWGVQYHPELRARHIADCLARPDGLFGGRAGQADDYRRAETDPAAAVRIGTTIEELAPLPRCLELRNWLRHLAERAAPEG